jgi:hypothetical protein
MSIKSDKIERGFILSLSVLSALIVSFLIKTIAIKIVYSIFAFFLTLILLLLLLSNTSSFSIKIRRILRNDEISKNAFYYMLALLATVFVMAFPTVTINIDPTSIWNAFASLSAPSLLRVISAFFLTSIFPGVIISSNFMKNYDLNLFERIGLVLLLSYCFTMINGLVLIWFQVFSNFSFILVLWISTGILGVYAYLKRRDAKEVLENHVFSFDTNLIALLLAGSTLVVLSYFQVLSSAPLTGIVSGDVTRYMVFANRFIYSEVFGWTPYVWSSVFYWLNASLAGIPMHYVSAGLQFYQIIFASAFYFFVRTLFPEHRKVAAVATLLCFFVAGVNSWLMISQMVASPSVFEGYIGGNTAGVLDFVFQHSGGAGLTSLSLGVWAFDFGLLFYALAFTYRGVFVGERKLTNYILPALFVSAAYFTHSFNILLLFVFSTLLFFLFLPTSRKYVFTVLSLTVVFSILFEPLSKWPFTNWLLGIMAQWNLQSILLGSNASNVIIVFVLIIGVAFAFFMFFKNKKQPMYRSKFLQDVRKILDRDYAKLAFYVLGFSVFFGSIILYFLNYESLMYTKIWILQDYVFPWYYIIFRSYGIILPFAFAAIPFVTKIKRSTLIFILIFSLAIFIPAIVSLAFPEVIPPSIGYTRYSAYLLFPFSILAALALLQSVKLLKKNKTRILSLLVLVVLISSSILSQAYTRELYYLTGQSKKVSDPTAESIEWINSNLPRDSSILPLTEFSEQLLSNLASGIRVIPNFQLWWLRDALLKSRPEVILYSLSKIGVNYIFVRNGEFASIDGFQESYFKYTLAFFPEVYHNDEVTIFKVPEFPIYEDSNFILVNPQSDADKSSVETAFGLLMSSGISFSIKDDADLSGLKPGNIYLFPTGNAITVAPHDVLEQIRQGASVISLNREFVCQILNGPYHSENEVIPTNSIDDWSIEAGGSGELAMENSDLLGNVLFAENASADGGGGLIYRYNLSSSLDLRGASSIELWFKTNATGNFYFGLLDGANNSATWDGKYDERYKITSEEVNKWVNVTLPIEKPTYIQPDFNLSNITFVQIGMEELEPNQKVLFSIGGIQALEQITKVDFVDGTSFPVSVTNPKVHLPSFGQILADYSLEDGSRIPCMLYTQIGSGSLIFINTAPLVSIQQTKDYELILKHIGTVLPNLLSITDSPKEKWDLSMFDDLFKEVTYTRFHIAFNLANITGKILWYDNVSLVGNVAIESNRICITHDQLTVERMDLWNGQKNLVLENATLHDATFLGEGNILLESLNTTLTSSPAGLYSIVCINGSGNFNMKLSKANVTFQLNTNNGSEYFDLSNVSLTLTLQQSASLLITSKQPTLQLDGSIKGIAQGDLIYNDKLYSPNKEKIQISGIFRLEIIYSSNITYSNMIEVKELKITFPTM